MTDFREKFRKGEAEPDDLEELMQSLQEEKSLIDKPDTSNLYNQNVYTSDDHEGDIKVNGKWVHKWYQRVINMLADGEDVVIIICGATGKGKSYTALRIGYELHNILNVCRGNFKPRDQAIYDVIDFLLFLRNSTRRVAMFDEAADRLPGRMYGSTFNTAVASALNTQRKRQNVYIFCSVAVNELDPRIVDSKDIVIELKDKQYAAVKSYKRKHGKVSKKGRNYQKADFGTWQIPDVPEDIQDTYENIDDEFKGRFLDGLLLKTLKKRMEEVEEEKTATL